MVKLSYALKIGAVQSLSNIITSQDLIGLIYAIIDKKTGFIK